MIRRAFICALLALLVLPAAAAAHAVVERTSPGQGSTVADQPGSVADALLFPLRFIVFGPQVELPFRDYRILAAYIFVPSALIAAACLRSRRPAAER